jgi:hypothetical protein
VLNERKIGAIPALFPLPACVIMMTALGVVVPFFWLGNASGHDFEYHVLSWMEVVNQWKQGVLFPRWAAFAHWGYGEARFLFYPPASWNLGAVLGAFLPWKIAPGAYIWCALTASGWSMFALARRWLSRSDVIFASALYVANPYYLVVVYWRSALAELLAGCLLPLLLLWIVRAAGEGPRVIVPLSLVVAAAWLTNAPSAVMVNYSLVLLVVVAAVVLKRPSLLLYGAGAVLLGLALSAFYVIPAAYEQSWVNIAEVLAPGLRPQDNFFFTTINDADHNRFNLLVSLVGVAEVVLLSVALYFSRKWREQDKLAWWCLAAWGSCAALLTLPVTLLFWQHLPKLRFVQLPWRWLLCVNVPFALLLAVACRRWVSRLVLCAAMFSLVWIVWHRVQAPWWDTAADIQEMHDFIEDGDGYEGTDEYVPADADPYEVSKNAPNVATVDGASALIHIDSWRATAKTFSIATSRPEQLRLRLFNYPAWRVEVNGREIHATTQPVTGEIVFPVSAGTSQITVIFSRTRDRLFGGVISIAGLLSLVTLLIFCKRRQNSSTDKTTTLDDPYPAR